MVYLATTDDSMNLHVLTPVGFLTAPLDSWSVSDVYLAMIRMEELGGRDSFSLKEIEHTQYYTKSNMHTTC